MGEWYHTHTGRMLFGTLLIISFAMLGGLGATTAQEAGIAWYYGFVGAVFVPVLGWLLATYLLVLGVIGNE